MTRFGVGVVVAFGVMTLEPSGAATSADAVIEGCMDCHGKDGVSTESDVPTIAGFSSFYFVDAMNAYKAGDRPVVESKYRAGDTSRAPTDMVAIAKELSDADIKTIAAFYEGKAFVPARQDFDAQKAAAGAKIHEDDCKKCHTEGGSSPDDDAGILAGQWMPYLRQSMDDYLAGTRPMDAKMKPKVEGLSSDEVEALIHYYASQQ